MPQGTFRGVLSATECDMCVLRNPETFIWDDDRSRAYYTCSKDPTLVLVLNQHEVGSDLGILGVY
jgi:hypothetical protein